MAVELQALAGPAGIEPDDDGGGLRVTRGFSGDDKPVGLQHMGQRVETGPGVAGRGRDRDEPGRRVEQAVAADQRADAVEHGQV